MSLSAGRVGVRADQVDSHGRVISPSFLNEIMEDLPEWTDLPVRVNGTEELIPSNPSVPVTSPILADIDYPDVRRNNQYFTYRESPTTVDGLAKIKSIKGNALVWNQLHQNQNGKSETAQYAYMLDVGSNFSVPSGHKLLVFFTQPTGCEVYATGRTGISVTYQLFPSVTTPTVRSFIGTTTSNLTGEYMNGTVCLNATVSSAVQLTNCMIFDLTQMCLDVTADQFRALFPLSYYAYNSGSLLSFNGTGIKTVGFNQWDEEWEVGGLDGNGNNYGNVDRIRSKNFIKVIPNATYFYHIDSTYGIFTWGYDANKNYVGRVPINGWAINNSTVIIPSNVSFIRFVVQPGYGTTYKNDICINISSSRNGEYEPYTSSTTDLPISTYFPTGMKSAGSVYDELTPSKAITRIGAVDLGTLNWTYDSTVPRFYSVDINSLVKKPLNTADKANAVSSMYENTSFDKLYASEKKNMTMAFGTTGTFSIINTSYSDVATFKTAMSGVYLYYELATPVELPTLDFGE